MPEAMTYDLRFSLEACTAACGASHDGWRFDAEGFSF